MSNTGISSATQGSTTQYRLGCHDLIEINGSRYHLDHTNTDGYLLRPEENSDYPEHFSFESFQTLIATDKANVCRNYFKTSEVTLRAHQGNISMTSLSLKEQEKIFIRQEYCDQILRLQAEQPKRLKAKVFREAIINYYMEHFILPNLRKGGARCDQTKLLSGCPKPSSVRQWLIAYKAAGYQPIGLLGNRRRSGNRTVKVDSESLNIAMKHVKNFADSRRPSIAMIYSNYNSELAGINSHRVAQGQREIPIIGKRTFEERVKKLDPYHVLAAREGAEAAKRKFGITVSSLNLTRPLERVEMDEWSVSLQALLVSAGAWEHMSKKDRDDVERSRAWVSAAIDCTSRCVLSLKLLDQAPSSASAIACLEMAVSDKSFLSKDAETQTPWDMHGSMESVVMDNGAAFVATNTVSVIRDLKAEPSHSPSGLKEMRGTIERLFGNFQNHFVHFFPGQTFENVVRKGDYDSEKNACINLDELNKTLVRYVVDVYHNTPHSGLAGKTPRNMWLELVGKYGVFPPPNSQERRHIFGISCQRVISNRGVRILGLFYQSPELQKFRRIALSEPVTVRVDRFDLGAVSVLTPMGWISVGVSENLNLSGVTWWEWIAASQDLRKKNADQSKLSANTVNASIRKFHDFADMATERAKIMAPRPSEEDFDKYEKELYRGFDFAKANARAEAAEPGDDFIFMPATNRHDPVHTPNSVIPPAAGDYDSDFTIISE